MDFAFPGIPALTFAAPLQGSGTDFILSWKMGLSWALWVLRGAFAVPTSGLSPLSPPTQKRCGNRRSLIQVYCTNSILGAWRWAQGAAVPAVPSVISITPEGTTTTTGVSKGPLL